MSVFGGFYILDHPVVMCVGDAFLPRLWWCGGHFREELIGVWVSKLLDHIFVDGVN